MSRRLCLLLRYVCSSIQRARPGRLVPGDRAQISSSSAQARIDLGPCVRVDLCGGIVAKLANYNAPIINDALECLYQLP